MNNIEFAAGSVPVITSIEEMNSKYGRINFYISPKLLWEDTGYLWKGERIYANDNQTRNI